VRLLDEILDEFDWTQWESKYVGNFGKPPIHPSVLCKVLLYALSRRIRSSRQIEYAVGHSIDFIWLTSGRTIDHTTLSELCIDGTKIQAKTDNPAYRADLSQPVAPTDIAKLPINASTKRFDRAAFVYNQETDTYHCPAGKTLTRDGKFETAIVAGVEIQKQNYRCRECNGCPLFSLCRVNDDSKTGRKVSHDQYREVRERQVERMQNPEVKQRYKKRQHYGETQFAFIKATLASGGFCSEAIRRFESSGVGPAFHTI